MAANFIVNVPKLKGRENYGDWAFAVENFLVLEGLSKCITEVVAEEDAKTKAKLISTLDPTLYVHIKSASTTKELWSKLKALFDDSGYCRKISLLRSLISTRLENCDSMVNYVSQVVETGQKLRGTGFNIDDEWIGSLLLAGLPEKFSPKIMAIEHSGIAISTDSIKTKLLDMEYDVSKNGSAFVSASATAKKAITCYNCKEAGHFNNQCPYNKHKSVDKKQKLTIAFSAVFSNGNFKKSDWCVDSGASVQLVADPLKCPLSHTVRK